MAYEWKDRVRFSDTDGERKLSMQAILNYFQDIATFHAEDLGVGIAYLDPQHMAWFLASWQITVFRYPDYFESVIVGTFPYRFRGSLGYRNFYLKTEAGELLAVADSIWTLVNVAEGKMALPTELMLGRYQVEEKLDMNYKGRRIAVPEDMQELPAFPIRRDHLDSNGHVNNGQFVRIAMEQLPIEVKPAELRAEYKHQIRLGQMVTPQFSVNGERAVVTLSTEEDGLCTVVEISF